MDLSKLIHGFLWSALWNCRNSFMDFFTLLHRLVKDFLCFSRILPNKTKLKFDQFVYMILSILRERYQFLVWPHFGETIYYCGSSRTTDRNQLAWSSLPPISAQPSTPHMRNIVHCIVQKLQCVKKMMLHECEISYVQYSANCIFWLKVLFGNAMCVEKCKTFQYNMLLKYK